MDEIEEIIGRAMSFTDLVICKAPQHAPFAIDRIGRLRDALAKYAPTDPALKRLDAYLLEIGRWKIDELREA